MALSSGARGKEDAAETRQAASAVPGLPAKSRALKTDRPKTPLLGAAKETPHQRQGARGRGRGGRGPWAKAWKAWR